MSSYDYRVAPRSVDVLPSRSRRRLTRRDGVLPLVLSLELVAGMAFGLAWADGQSTTVAVPAKLQLAPVALVTVLPSSAPLVGPAVGPLVPGSVRAPLVQEAAPQVVTVRRHAPRNPFGALVTVSAP
jgi:hypothetical protein